jgi:hypothetical protein
MMCYGSSAPSTVSDLFFCIGKYEKHMENLWLILGNILILQASAVPSHKQQTSVLQYVNGGLGGI